MNSTIMNDCSVDNVAVSDEITTILESVDGRHSRTYTVLRNRSNSNTVYLSVGSTDPEVEKGICLDAGEAWELLDTNLTLATIKGVCSSGKSANIAVFSGKL